MILESGWDKNHWFATFCQNCATKWQHFSLKITYFSTHFDWFFFVILWIFLVFTKRGKTVIIISAWLRTHIWVMWVMAILGLEFSNKEYKIRKIFVNQHTSRKLLNFEFWISSKLSKNIEIQLLGLLVTWQYRLWSFQ